MLVLTLSHLGQRNLNCLHYYNIVLLQQGCNNEQMKEMINMEGNREMMIHKSNKKDKCSCSSYHHCWLQLYKLSGS